MKEYSHIVFDLDGTLADPKIGIVNSIKFALKKLNSAELDESILHKFIGPPLQDSFMKHCGFDEQKTNEAIAYFREYFSEKGIFENHLYPYVPQLLLELSLKEKNCYIATTKPTIFAKQIVDHFKIGVYFTDIEGSRMDTPEEEKTPILKRLLERNAEINSENGVMIGDRKYDMLAGQAHKIDTVAALYGYGQKQELEAAGAFYFAKDIDEVSTIIL